MDLKGIPVLVTGADGFIGSHLVERLVAEGAKTRALCMYNSRGSWGWLDQAAPKVRDCLDVRLGDIRDARCVEEACKDVEIIFHLAALISIPYSYAAPASYVDTNINGTLNLLEAARRHQVGRVIHTSTSEVYGTARYVPIDEAHPLQAQSPYAASKIGADKLAESYHLSFGLPVVTVRPFNTYGPRQSTRAVIPSIITQCLRGERVQLGNLNPTRDLNFVADTVEGFLRAAIASDAVGCTINLGSGREVCIGDLALLIARLMDRRIEIITDDQRTRPEKSEVERLLSDNSLARELLGWQPAWSLEAGLTCTIDWMRAHLESYRPDVYYV